MNKHLIASAVLLTLGACGGGNAKETSSFTWDTDGQFEISCSQTQGGFMKSKPSDELSEKMKTAAVRICGDAYRLGDLSARVKTSTSEANEYDATISFECDVTEDVQDRANSFRADVFCARVI